MTNGGFLDENLQNVSKAATTFVPEEVKSAMFDTCFTAAVTK